MCWDTVVPSTLVTGEVVITIVPVVGSDEVIVVWEMAVSSVLITGVMVLSTEPIKSRFIRKLNRTFIYMINSSNILWLKLWTLNAVFVLKGDSSVTLESNELNIPIKVRSWRALMTKKSVIMQKHLLRYKNNTFKDRGLSLLSN